MARLLVVAACCVALTACGGAAPSSRARDPVRYISVDAQRTLTVVETRVPRQITLAEFARNEPKMIRLALHAHDVHLRATRYRGRRALRVSYLRGTNRVVQYFVRRGDVMLVSTYTYR